MEIVSPNLCLLNPFHTDGLFLYPQKKSENPDVLRGYGFVLLVFHCLKCGREMVALHSQASTKEQSDVSVLI